MRIFIRLKFGEIMVLLIGLGAPVGVSIGAIHEYFGPERCQASAYEYSGVFAVILPFVLSRKCSAQLPGR